MTLLESSRAEAWQCIVSDADKERALLELLRSENTRRFLSPLLSSEDLCVR